MNKFKSKHKRYKRKQTKRKNRTFNKRNKISGGAAADPAVYNPGITVNWSSIEWPPNCGCLENFKMITLQPDKILSRFGSNSGGFLGDDMIPYCERSIPYIKTVEKYNEICDADLNGLIEKDSFWKYHRFQVVKKFKMFTCSALAMNANKTGQTTYIGGANQYFMFKIESYSKLKNKDTDDKTGRYYIEGSNLSCNSKTIKSVQNLIDDGYLIEINVNKNTYPSYS